MRLTSLDWVDPKAVLAKPLLDASNRPLLNEGVSLTPAILSKLKSMGYTAIYVKDSLTYDIEVEDYIPPETKNKVIKEVRSTFAEIKKSPKLGYSIPSKAADSLLNLFKDMLSSINEDSLFELHMGTILNKDSELFEHCFNVALYSTIMATAAGLKEDKVRAVGVGGLLHDVGKVAIPDSILNKPGKLTPEEWEVMQQHTTMGYDIIRKQQAFSLVSAHCAYQHHERLDGSGYPRGLKGEDIHVIGRIMAIADVFDAMTAPRVYKDPILPSDVLEFIYAHSGTSFDRQFVDVFRNNIALYPVGSQVSLSDDRLGVIVKNRRDFPSRPLVRIFSDHGEKVNPYDVDLSTTLNVVVASTFKESALQSYMPVS